MGTGGTDEGVFGNAAGKATGRGCETAGVTAVAVPAPLATMVWHASHFICERASVCGEGIPATMGNFPAAADPAGFLGCVTM